MPSRACGHCELDFPLRAEYERCPVCWRPTELRLMQPADEYWEEKVHDHFQMLTESEDEAERIVGWRVLNLHDMGYTWDQASKLGYRHHGPDKVDIRKVEEHIARGATLKQAALIEA